MEAHADLNLSWANMSEVMFSHVAAKTCEIHGSFLHAYSVILMVPDNST